MTTFNQNTTSAHLAAAYIQDRAPHFKPRIGIVLGSGLGEFATQLENPICIAYDDLPGFPSTTIKGHGGCLTLGQIAGVSIVCLSGRAHRYEGNTDEAVKTYVRTLKLLGCDYFLATNAAGSLNEAVAPGELMLITDHINMQPGNPLVGPNDHAFGPRFLPLDEAYNLSLREQLLSAADAESIRLHQGVYIAVLGPNYETAAEIRAFRMLGADAVGMSTVAEVLIAHHCGMKVAVISTLTNFATGLNKTAHSHDDVLDTAAHAVEKLKRLLNRFVATLA